MADLGVVSRILGHADFVLGTLAGAEGFEPSIS